MKNILFAILLSLAVISNLAYAEVKAVSKTADVNVNNVNEEDLQKILALAKQGDVEAQFKLGLMYYIGESVSQDYKQAAYWFEKAATLGVAKAQYNLGLMYDNGQGVTQDYKQAAYWYEKAATQGLAKAQYNLGYLYANGQGVTQDYKQAVNWYEKSATQGVADAQNNLGLMYDKGQGVTKNLIKAHMWANIAASNNGIDRKLRDSVAKKLTSEQLNKAQEMAKKCLSSKYKNCQ